MDVKGLKIFKPNNDRSKSQKKDIFSRAEGESFDVKNARDIFRKMTLKTSYYSQFGEPPKATEDFVVLKQKKFGALDISKFINPEAVKYVEKWMTINDYDDFIKRLFFTTREINTIIRN